MRDNAIVARVAADGTILNVWVGDRYAGALAPDEIAGLHIKDFFAPDDVRHAIEVVTRALRDHAPLRFEIAINLPVRHRLRLARILPLPGNEILAYIYKEADML